MIWKFDQDLIEKLRNNRTPTLNLYQDAQKTSAEDFSMLLLHTLYPPLCKILVKFRVLRASKNANLFPVSKNLKFSSDSLAGNGFSFEGFLAMPTDF